MARNERPAMKGASAGPTSKRATGPSFDVSKVARQLQYQPSAGVGGFLRINFIRVQRGYLPYLLEKAGFVMPAYTPIYLLAFAIILGCFRIWRDERRAKEKAMQPIAGIWKREAFVGLLEF
jgi:hypothetical protein